MRTNILRATGVALALFISSVSAQTEPLAVTPLVPDEFAWVRHCDLHGVLTDLARGLRVVRDSSRINRLADTFDALARQAKAFSSEVDTGSR
jgi:hypothetical protein